MNQVIWQGNDRSCRNRGPHSKEMSLFVLFSFP